MYVYIVCPSFFRYFSPSFSLPSLPLLGFAFAPLVSPRPPFFVLFFKHWMLSVRYYKEETLVNNSNKK